MNRIKLSKTCNTRYLGKLYNAEIIRSDALLQACDDDIKILTEMNINTIIDLRSAGEVNAKPCNLKENTQFNYYHISLHSNGIIPPDANKVPYFYFEIADEQEAVCKVLKTIAYSSSGVIFYCRSGKDRTGIIAAILLALIGMSENDIATDYALSGIYLHDIIEEWSKRNPDFPKEVITPKEEHIINFLKLLYSKYDSAYNYCKNIGLSEFEISRIKSKMIKC